MNELKLTSIIPPSVNHYLVHYVDMRKYSKSARSKPIVRSYLAPPVVEFKNTFLPYVKKQIEEQGWIQPREDQIIDVVMIFYVHKKRIDPNNLMKIPIDVLKEAGVYFDDDLVMPIAQRVYIDSVNPRIEYIITARDNVGVFDSFEDHDKFVELNCSGCSRSGRCPVYKTLIDNRIVPGVDEKAMICWEKKEKKK